MDALLANPPRYLFESISGGQLYMLTSMAIQGLRLIG